MAAGTPCQASSGATCSMGAAAAWSRYAGPVPVGATFATTGCVVGVGVRAPQAVVERETEADHEQQGRRDTRCQGGQQA